MFLRNLYNLRVIKYTMNKYIQNISSEMRLLAKHFNYSERTTLNRMRCNKEDPFRILVSCLLSLRTQDKNTEKASNMLFAEADMPRKIIALPMKKLEKLIYSSGHYKKKSRVLKSVSKEILTRFNGKVESVNLTGKTSVNITIDNNTDIMRVAFKIRGYPVSGSFPNNTIIDVDKDNKSDIVIPGIIQENVIEINEFIVSGSSKRASNLTYITAGSKTININASSIFDVNNFSMQLSSYSLDAENVFSYTEHFNGTDGIKGFNETLSYQSDAPLGILDEFIANNSKWTFSITDTNDDNNNQGLISYGGGGLAINLIDDGEITPHSNSVYTNYDDEAGDLRNSSLVEIISSYYIDSPQIGGFARIRLYATDGTSRIELFEKEVENTLSFDVINITVKKTSSDYKTWQIFQNLSNLGNKDISSLNFNNQIKLEFFNEVIFNNQYPFISRWNLSEIKWSGAWINRSTINGTYKPSGNITSNILIYTATNVSRAILSWSVYEPLGTKILGYISNTCNATNPRFQSVSNEINSVFDTTGNAVCYRFNLNSSINTTSPIIRKVTFDITSGAIRNVTIDCGADGDNDWNFLNELNSTTSPRIVNCSMGEFSAYKTANCLNTKLCQYPISLSTKSGGLLSIDNINITQSLDEIVLSNLTRLETQTEWSFNYSFLNGLLNIYDLDIEFKGSKNFTLYAYSQSNTSYLQGTANLTLRVYYSKFNATFPKGMNEMQLIYPEFFNLNQSNISVYGQTLRYCNSSVDAKCAHFSTPIFNITNLAYDLPSDVYLYANNTINNTINHSFDLGVNRTTAIQIFNASETKIITNLSKDSSKSIFGFVDIKNMTWEKLNSTNFNYVFLWKTFCNGCVR